MKTNFQKCVMILLLALIVAVGIGVSSSGMAFASTRSNASTSPHKTSLQSHTLSGVQSGSVTCGYWAVPGGPYALAVIYKANPSYVVYLEAIPYGAGNLTYYVWQSFNGFPGNPISEPQHAPNTYVYDILIAGYISNTPAAYICSDWTIVNHYVRMY